MEEISIFDYIEDNHYQYKKVFPCDHRIRIFEAFAGIGCQRMAAEMLKVPYEVVGISEIDKYAIQSYMAMHGDTPNYGDITKMTYIPQCDIFTWSFPCTDLSKAGKRAGLDIGTRSGLVYEVLRLLKATEFKPKVLIMENVPDLVQETFKAQFYEIQKELERLGYKNYTRVLNAKNYGIAQNRERVFMVSILGNEHYEFPIPFKLETRLKDYLEPSVDEKYYLSDKQLGQIANWKSFQNPLDNVLKDESVSPCITTRVAETDAGGISASMIVVGQASSDGSQAGKIYDNKGIAPTLCAGNHGYAIGYITAFMPSIEIPEDTIKGYALASDGDGVYINRPEQKRGVVQKGMIQTLKTSCDDVGVVVAGEIRVDEGIRTFKDNLMGTIRTTESGGDKIIINNQSLRIRKLTPLECWRLMGISDEYFNRASQVCSNSQLYKQAGNGIVVNVFAEILKGLIEVQNGRE